MLFNSINYLFFFPIVVLLYFLIPKKAKNIWLLAASYYFYMCWNAKYILLILFSTVITYVSGILLERAKEKRWEDKKKVLYKKGVVAASLLLNLGTLFYFKYTGFALESISRLLGLAHIDLQAPTFDIVLPIGISFFTFQALGYTIDVYRDEIKAETNFFRYALFVSFFPQLVAGPIERSKNLLFQLQEPKRFNVSHAKSGLLTMAYGLFLKMVVADNIACVIDPVFENPQNYLGMELLVAVVLFAFQIYCDFEGYTKMAIGSADVLGYQLKDNFKTPYFAESVKDFWRRWHISLTSWFRDYLYIPLGGGQNGRVKKQINTMIIFLCSGLWHGAAWHYVVWGGLNGLFSVMEDLVKPLKRRLYSWLKIDASKRTYKIFQRICTFILIDFTWLFFRAPSFQSGVYILKSIIGGYKWEWLLIGGYSDMFGTTEVMMIILLSLILVCAHDWLKYKGRDITESIFKQQILFRWGIYWLLLMIIVYWGVYGTGYEQTQFIYFQF